MNDIAGRHTNVSVNGSWAFLPLQGNPWGWHGVVQSGAGRMTHSGKACRIVERTIWKEAVCLMGDVDQGKGDTNDIRNMTYMVFMVL